MKSKDKKQRTRVNGGSTIEWTRKGNKVCLTSLTVANRAHQADIKIPLPRGGE